MPVYVVFRYSNDDLVKLTIDTVNIMDSVLGNVLLSGKPTDTLVALNVSLGPFTTAQYNFTKIFGPFMPKCQYLDISASYFFVKILTKKIVIRTLIRVVTFLVEEKPTLQGC